MPEPAGRGASGRGPARRTAGRGSMRGTAARGPVRILFLDADGTLTDGVISFSRAGDSVHFWVRDGIALEWARDSGLLPVVVSGRNSRALAARMQDLGVEHYLGAKDKVAVAERVMKRERVNWDQCAMLGDDLPDVPLLKRVGWPMAVAGCAPELRRVTTTVTKARPGAGAVREVVERLLRHNGTWARVLERYGA